MSKEVVLFKNDEGAEITLEHLFKKIYEVHEEKNKNILASADHLKGLIVTLQDAVVIMPSLVALQQTAVNNDEKLVKLAALVQKMVGKQKDTSPVDGYIMSKEEREELLKNYNTRPGTAKGNAASSE